MRVAKLALIGGLVLGSTLAVALYARQGGRASPHESVSDTIDGSLITITGTGFSPIPGDNQVSFTTAAGAPPGRVTQRLRQPGRPV